jgi:PTS system mannose-specific IIA component
MVGLVLISHGQMGHYLLESAELIAGTQEQVATVSLVPEDSPESFQAKMLSAIQSIDTDKGLLVLSDLCGGTPWNCTAVLSRDEELECLTGMNLPMLLEILMIRPTGVSVRELADIGEAAGRAGIVRLSRMLEDAE